MSDQELLHKIDVRLARVEERLKDLHEIKKSLDNLKWKVAGISGSISIAFSIASLFLK